MPIFNRQPLNLQNGPALNLQNVLNLPSQSGGECGGCNPSKKNPNLNTPESNPCVDNPAPDQSYRYPNNPTDQPSAKPYDGLDNQPSDFPLNKIPSEASDLLKSVTGGNPVGLPSRIQPWLLPHLTQGKIDIHNPTISLSQNGRKGIIRHPTDMAKVPTSPHPCKDNANGDTFLYSTPLMTIGTQRIPAMGYASAGVPINEGLFNSVNATRRTNVNVPSYVLQIPRKTIKPAQHKGYGQYNGSAIS